MRGAGFEHSDECAWSVQKHLHATTAGWIKVGRRRRRKVIEVQCVTTALREE
jgi:hypothetical protein